MTHLTLVPQSEADNSRAEKFQSGENQARIFLLSNADFIYRLIDHVGSLDEAEKRVPQSVIYFFQVLIKASNEAESYPDLVTKLALLEHAIVSPKTFLPRYQFFADDLAYLKDLVVPSIVQENIDFNSNLKAGDISYIFSEHYKDFSRLVLRLVESEEFLIFAKDSLPRISIQSLYIRQRELSYVKRLEVERGEEIKPDDIYGIGRNYDTDLSFVLSLKSQYRGDGLILGPAG